MRSESLLHFKQLLQASILIVLAAIGPSARGANLTWDADLTTTGAQDGPGIWDTTANNWWTGTANAAWNSTVPDFAFFGSANGAAGTVTLGANVVAGNLTFNAPSAGTYTIAGGGFTLGLTNRTITANAASATISADITGGTLTLVNSGGNTPSGVLTLTGNSSFTNFNLGSSAGNTTAALRIGSSTALGLATGTIGIAGGQGNQTSHRIELAGNGMTISNSIPGQLGRNNYSAVIVNLGTGNTWAGRLTRGTGGQDTHIASEVANGITFSGANNGGIALSSQAGAPRNFVLRGSGGGTISGVISNGSAANNLGLVKAGSGTWTLSGANTFTNGVIVDEGTLALDYSTQDNSKLPDQGPLTLGGGTVSLNGGTHTETVFLANILGGHSRITRNSGTATIRLNALNRSRGGVVDFSAASIADTDALNVNGILGGYATVGGANWAVNSTGGADGAIIAYTGYTDIAASGSTIADGATSNVRLNSAGGGGSIALGATTTTINTLLQNTTTAATVNTAGGTLRLGLTGGVLVPATSQSLTLGTAANAGSLTAGGADNTAGEIILINNSANALTVNATITDNGTGPVSLTKAGTGTATLTGNNTHTGTNVIAGGTLNISSDANLGAVPAAVTSSSVLINGGVLNTTEDITLDPARGISLGPTSRYGNGTISVAAAKTLTIPGTVANADVAGNGPGASLTKTGNGTLILSGANTYTSGTIINGGTVSIFADNNLGSFFQAPGCYMIDNLVLNSGTLDVQGSFTMSANRGLMLGPIGGAGSGTVSVADFQLLTFNGRITDNWNGSGSLTKTGNGTLCLGGGLNDYSGNTTVSAGTLQLGNARAIPNGPGKGNLILNGTLDLNNISASVNGLSGSGTVDNIAFGAATFSVGYNDVTSTFSGAIQNTGAGTLSLTKAGAGTLTLSGPFSANANLTVAGGALVLSGSATPSLVTNFTVRAGATLNVSGVGGLTLAAGQSVSGSGSVAGNVSETGATIAPGTSAGTLTVTGNLNLNGGGTLNFELSDITTVGSGVNDLIIVTGDLNLAGPTTLNLSYLAGAPAVGVYTLVQYGSFSGNIANLTAPLGFSVNNNTLAKTIELVVTHSPATITWAGDGVANIWDAGTTANWIQDGTNQFFFTGDSVVFDDTGSSTPAITLTATMFPAAVTVNNTAQDYTFAGSPIGTGSLTKDGTGALVLENDNVYAGPTVIVAGNLQVGNGGTTGRLGTGAIANNGGLIFNRADDLIVANPISGSGLVTQFGGAVVALTASNSYAGNTTINNGVLAVRNNSALGSVASGTTVNAGGQLFIDQNVNITNESLTLSGAGPGSGALRKGGGGPTTWTGPVSIFSDAIIHLDGGATLSLIHPDGIAGSDTPLTLAGDGGGQGFVTGPISIGAVTLTKNGEANWTVAATNSYTGKTVINGGTLFIPALTALGPISTFAPDYVFLNGGSLGVTNDLAFNDNLRGFTAAAGGFNVGPGATLIVSNDITGAGTLTKSGAGTLVLTGPKTFAGTLNVDTAATGGTDGITRITTGAAIANLPVTPGTPTIFLRNNNAAASTLQLDGTAGSIVIPQDVQLSCRNVTNYTLQNLAGSNVFAGSVRIEVGGADQWWQCEAGTLTFTGNIDYIGTLTGGRNYHFQGPGNFLVTGNINASPLGSPIAVTKDGPGTLTLAGVNTYGTTTAITNGMLLLTGSISHTGAVTVVGGTLAGTGTINAAVDVLAGGTLAPGTSIGTLTINNNLTLAGTTAIEVNKANGQRDQVVGVSALTYGGTLFATNVAGTPVAGDTFTIFSATTPSGDFTSIVGTPGPGLEWEFNPATGVLSVVPGIPSTPTNITFSVSGNTLSLSWPANYLGVILQTQTNSVSVGISNNWVDVPGTALVTSTNIAINPANPTVFFRLRHP